jgi:hypothetical protein
MSGKQPNFWFNLQLIPGCEPRSRVESQPVATMRLFLGAKVPAAPDKSTGNAVVLSPTVPLNLSLDALSEPIRRPQLRKIGRAGSSRVVFVCRVAKRMTTQGLRLQRQVERLSGA